MAIYLFDDWTAVCKMRNEIDPNLRADAQVVRYGVSGIAGHILKVYDKESGEVKYSFGIDLGVENTFSLTREDAIDMMNQIGFACEWQGVPVLPPEAIEVLTNVHELGYTTVFRTINPAKVFVEREHNFNDLSYSPKKVINLNEITEINYHDYIAVPVNQRVFINGLINE